MKRRCQVTPFVPTFPYTMYIALDRTIGTSAVRVRRPAAAFNAAPFMTRGSGAGSTGST